MSIWNRSFLIASLVIGQIAVALITQILIIKIIGIGHETDIFIAAQTIPLIFFTISASILQSIWLPKLSKAEPNSVSWLKELKKTQAHAVFFSLFLLLVILTSQFWFPIFFPTFNHSLQHQGIYFSVILLVAQILNINSTVHIVALKSQDKFVKIEFISFINGLVSIGMLLVFLPIYGVEAAVWVILVRVLFTYLAYIYLAGTFVIPSYENVFDIDVWRITKPLLFGTSIYKTSPLVDRYWISQSQAGGMTLFNLAQLITTSLSTVFERTFVAPVIPSLSRAMIQHDYFLARKLYLMRIVFMAVLTIITIAAILIFKSELSWILSKVLSLETNQTEYVILLCLFLSGYVFSSCAGSVVVGTFHAYGNTKLPVKISLIGFILSIPFKSASYIFFGLEGIALAISIYYLFNLIAMVLVLEKSLSKWKKTAAE